MLDMVNSKYITLREKKKEERKKSLALLPDMVLPHAYQKLHYEQ
jgi:hypothetical protein